MLNSPDQFYTVSITALWSVGELTAGFLIIGIPCLPKVVKSISLTEWVNTLIRSWKRTVQSGFQNSSRRGLRSWYKQHWQKRLNQTSYSDIDKHDHMYMKSAMGAEERMPIAINREVRLQMTNEPRFDVMRPV